PQEDPGNVYTVTPGTGIDVRGVGHRHRIHVDTVVVPVVGPSVLVAIDDMRGNPRADGYRDIGVEEVLIADELGPAGPGQRRLIVGDPDGNRVVVEVDAREAPVVGVARARRQVPVAVLVGAAYDGIAIALVLPPDAAPGK